MLVSGSFAAAVKKNSFGNISGVVDTSNFLAVEFQNDLPKTISHIAASFRARAAEFVKDEFFNESVVAVFRGKVEDFPLAQSIEALEGTQNLEHLRFFNSYEGFSDPVYITAGKSDVLSVVLFAPVFRDTLPGADAAFGSLSVFGAFAEDKALFTVG